MFEVFLLLERAHVLSPVLTAFILTLILVWFVLAVLLVYIK